MDKISRAFASQKGNARARGIKFEFSLEEWERWWIGQLGHGWLEKRGVESNQYCMARNGNIGPYAKWNVRCITNRENALETDMPRGEKHCCAKLNLEQVGEARQIYIPYHRQYGGSALAKRYGVAVSTMTECLRMETWR